MKIDNLDIEEFRWYIDDHLDEVTTTLNQYRDLCLEDEMLAIRSEKLINLLKGAQSLLDKASIEVIEVGMDMFGENL